MNNPNGRPSEEPPHSRAEPRRISAISPGALFERMVRYFARDTAAGGARPNPVRRRVYEILEAGHGDDAASKLFDGALVTLILLNIAAFIAETVPSIAEAYGSQLQAFELVSVAIFTIEYLLRMWAAVEVPFLKRLPPAQARFRFARRGSQVIDLLAILPFYLAQFFNIDLRVLRALRLLRFLKLSRYSPAMHSLLRVLQNERRSLMGAALLLVAALLFASTGIYYLESAAQPDKFGSVPESAWWAMATLTTVGYGDIYPVTPLGRLFGGFVMITGLCILALPVAIIAAGFAQEVARRDFVVNWSLMSRIPMLSQLDAREVGEVMPLLHAHNLPPNVEVLAEGSEATAIYFIASGRVKFKRADGEQVFSTGEVFGIIAMLDNDLHAGSFVTAAKCRLLKLHKEDFHRLETANAAIAAHIRRTAAERRRAREERAAAKDAAVQPTATE
ncbi:MAG: cyclic nucleotide-gated ion channel [Hyphomicrobium sp.]